MKPRSILSACLVLAASLLGLARGDDFYVATVNDKAITLLSDGKTSIVATADQPFWGIAADAEGNVYVANVGAGSILEFPAAHGAQVANPRVVGCGLHEPLGLAFDHAGSLFVSEKSGNIYKYPRVAGVISPNAVLVVDGSPAQANLQGTRQPDDLAFDRRGNLYVALEIGGILRFRQTASGLSKLPDVRPFSTVSRARQMAFDREGNLFTANHLAGEWCVYKFPNTPTGLSNAPQIFATGHGLDGPYGVTIDSDGNLFVTNWGGYQGSQVLKFPFVDGKLSAIPEIWAGGFDSPVLIVAAKTPRQVFRRE